MTADASPHPVYKLTDARPEDYAQREGQAVHRRVIVSIPAYDGAPSHITQSSFLRSRDLANSLGIGLDINMRVSDSSITRARDIMASEFLDRWPQATAMLFWDSDVGCEPEGLIRMINHPVDFVGGAYRSRGDPEVYVLRSLENELQRDKTNGLMEVEGVPTGFLYLTRRVLDVLTAAQEKAAVLAKTRAAQLFAWLERQEGTDDVAIEDIRRIVAADCEQAQQYWYTDPTAPGLNIRALFNFEVRGNRLYSEDYNFCRRWRALGEKCWIDPDQTLHHIGKKVFSGNLMKWLEAHAPKIPDQVAKGGAAAHFAPGQGRAPSMLDMAKGLVGDAA
jgi:hypothetical protein